MPICESVPNQRVNNVGNILKLKGISEKSHPLVDLKWKNDISGNNLKAINVSDANNVAFKVGITIHKHHSTVFVCLMKSPGLFY